MNPVAKTFIIIGVILVVVGLIWQVGGKYLPLGRLPGDVVVEKEQVKIYFPIMTCILISVILSLVSYLIRFFR
ncbi:DUF2905 domain-containing protein [Laceyella sacchari]|jgi:hypothetical protein|uniref:DUF2905 domain-containing protein n=2 Tax=Laceyella TaxID=292635 RepID=A0AA46AGG7_9BACL|nr:MULTISPECIES: DUF2905 domain-containing protein [Laceyella]AUS08461.1 DUF2905 domain-containing protein [Laceyella sacchari]MRG26757.1 DUF2905 family protein [Laceyella tengchongensis]PRZ15802.1 Protein of unknown function (DUF2905) [Laceyella sediminis]SMP28140.1 Protein of unknown function [Laceyella tengchongensis]